VTVMIVQLIFLSELRMLLSPVAWIIWLKKNIEQSFPAGRVYGDFIVIFEPPHLWGANADKIDRDVLINRAMEWI